MAPKMYTAWRSAIKRVKQLLSTWSVCSGVSAIAPPFFGKSYRTSGSGAGQRWLRVIKRGLSGGPGTRDLNRTETTTRKPTRRPRPDSVACMCINYNATLPAKYAPLFWMGLRTPSPSPSPLESPTPSPSPSRPPSPTPSAGSAYFYIVQFIVTLFATQFYA